MPRVLKGEATWYIYIYILGLRRVSPEKYIHLDKGEGGLCFHQRAKACPRSCELLARRRQSPGHAMYSYTHMRELFPGNIIETRALAPQKIEREREAAVE